jgi:phosphoribosylamine--glycine ligase
VLATVVQPTVDELARRGTPFAGLLYAGLALTSRGLRVVEFNVRFGDPETQPLLALLESPLGELLMAAATGRLADVAAPVFADGAAVAVVMASRGYPASSSSGDVISGIDAAEALDGVQVLHAGTALRDGALVTAGGRVLAVVGTGADVAAARSAAYAGVAEISFDGAQHRADIAAAAEVSPGSR